MFFQKLTIFSSQIFRSPLHEAREKFGYDNVPLPSQDDTNQNLDNDTSGVTQTQTQILSGIMYPESKVRIIQGNNIYRKNYR